MPNNRWIHNFGQSIKYSAHDALKDIAPTITQTVTDASADLRGMRNTLKYAKRRKELLNNYLTGDNPELGDQIDQAKNNIKKSFRTGKFYQTEDEQMAGIASAIGGEDAKDLLSMFDDVDDDFETDNPETADADQSTSIISKELGNTSKKIGLSTMQAAYTTAKAIRGQTSTISSGFMVANNAINTLSANVVSVVEIAAKEHSELLTGITNKIDTINTFNTDSVSPFFQASITYYNDSLAVFREMNESMKTIAGTANPQEAKDRSYNNELLDLINGKEGFKLSNIAKFGALNAHKKVNDATFGIGEMLPMLLGMVGGNPMSFVLTEAMKAMIPKKISKPLGSLDKSFKNFIPALFNQMGKYSGDNTLFSVLSGIFGIDITGGKRKLDLSSYNKTAIPFDGITKKAITEVIPTYLSKILQTLEGSDNAHIFDYEKGKFTTAGKVQHQFKKSMREARTSGASDIMNEIDTYLYRSNVDDKNKKLITKAIRDMINQSVKTGSSIDFNDTKTFSGVKDTDLQNLIQKVLANGLSNSSQIALLYNAIEEGSAAYSDAMDSFQNSGNMTAFNGMFKNKKKKKKKKNGNTPTPVGAFDSLNDTKKAVEQSSKVSKGNAIAKDKLAKEKNSTLTLAQLADSLPDKEEQKKRGWDVPAGITEEESANGKGGFMNTVAKYVNRPVEFVGDVVRGLDTSLHAILFGKKGSVFKNIIIGIQTTFVNTFSWIRDKMLNPLKEGLFGKNIKDSKMYKGIASFVLGEKGKDGKYTGGLLSGLRNEASNIWDETKKAWTENVTPIINEAGNLLADYIAPSPKDEKGKDGKRVPIIDRLYNGLNTGFSNFLGAMFGSNNSKFDNKKYASVSMKELRAKLPKSLAIGGLGAGLGVANGLGAFGLFGQMFLPGGPLGGLIVGSVVGFASQSNRVKDYLFGKEVKQSDGTTKRAGGFISSGVQNWFKENKVPIVGGALFGVAKAAVFGGGGLVPGVAMAAFGPAIMGAAYGLAKKSQYIQDILFGHDVTLDDGTTKKVGGIFSKVSNLQLSRVLPNMGAGALLGMGASSVVGSMGLVGSMIALGPIPSAILGAGMGIAISSKKLTRRLFGFMDNKGNYHSGVFDRIGNAISLEVIRPFKLWAKGAFVDIKHWFATSVGIPLRQAFHPLKVMVTDIAKSITKGIRTGISRIFGGISGILHLMLGQSRNIFNTLTRVTGSILGKSIYGAARLAAMPIEAGVGAVGLLGKVGAFHIRNKARHEAIDENKQKAYDELHKGNVLSAAGYKAKQFANYLNFNNTDNADVQVLNAENTWGDEARLNANKEKNEAHRVLDLKKRDLRIMQNQGARTNYVDTPVEKLAKAKKIQARLEDQNKIFEINKTDDAATQAAKANVQYAQKQVQLVTSIEQNVDTMMKVMTGQPIKRKVMGLVGSTGAYEPGANDISKDSRNNSTVGDSTYANHLIEKKNTVLESAILATAKNTEDINKNSIGNPKNSFGQKFKGFIKDIGFGIKSLIFGVISAAPTILGIAAGITAIAGLVYKILYGGGTKKAAEDIATEFNGRRGINVGRNVAVAGFRGAMHVKDFATEFAAKNPKTVAAISKKLGSIAAKAPVNKIYARMNGKAVEGVTNKIYAGTAKKSTGIVAKATHFLSNTKIAKTVSAFCSNSTVIQLFGKGISKVGQFLTKWLNKIGGSALFNKAVSKIGMKAGARTAATAYTLGVATIGFGIYDAASGYFDAAYLFDQPEDTLNWKQKAISSVTSIFWGLPGMYIVDGALTIVEGVGVGAAKGTPIETITTALGLNPDQLDHRKLLAYGLYYFIANDEEKGKSKEASASMNEEYTAYVKEMQDQGKEADNKETWMKNNGKSGGSLFGRIADTVMHPIDTIKGWLGFGDKKKQVGFAGSGVDKNQTLADKALAAKDAAGQVLVDGFNSVGDTLSTAFSYIKKGILGYIKLQTSPVRFALSMFGFDMFLDDKEKKGVANIQKGIAGLMNWVGEKFFQISEGFGNFINNGVQLMQDIAKALAEKAGQAVDNAVQVVTHPVDTIKNVASSAWKGIKNFFGFKGSGTGASFAGAGRSLRPMGSQRTSRPLGKHAFSGGAADGISMRIPNFNIGDYTGKLSSIANNISSVVNGGQSPLQLVSDIIHNRRIKGTDTSSTSSSSGSSDSVNSGSLEGNAKRVYEFLRQQGYSNSAAAGIMGNLQQEHNFDPSDVGEHVNEDGLTYGGLGIVQWNGGRTQALRQYASEQGKDPEDLELQLEYMAKEINDSYTDVNPDNMNSLTPEEAAARWNKYYEVGTRTDLRQQYANELYSKINGGEFGGQGIPRFAKFMGSAGIGDTIMSPFKWVGSKINNVFGQKDQTDEEKANMYEQGGEAQATGINNDSTDDLSSFKGEPNVYMDDTGLYGLGTKNFASFGDWISPVGYYRQNDPFWDKWGFAHKLAKDKHTNYGTLGDNGCGVLSLSNALMYGEDGLKDSNANPLKINDMLTADDIDDNGSSSSLISNMTDSNVFSRIGDSLGKNIEPYRGTLDEFKGQLAAGSSFILGGKSPAAPFSNRGHYVFATGLGERQVTDADGNNPKRVPATAVIDPAGLMTGVYPLEDLAKISIDTSANKDMTNQKVPGVAYVVSPKKPTWYRSLVGNNGAGKNGKGKNNTRQEAGGLRGMSFLYAYAKAAASEYINCITEGRSFKAPKYRKLKDGSFVIDDDKKNVNKLSKTKDTEVDTSNTDAKFEKDSSGIITGPNSFKGYKGEGNFSFQPYRTTDMEGMSAEGLQFLNAISNKWYDKYKQKLIVSSAHRSDNPNSDHYDGHAFDVSDDLFDQDPARREDYMKMAFNLGGKQIIDEFSDDWDKNYGSGNIHVSVRSPFFEGGSILPMIANRVPNSDKALGNQPFSGAGFGFGRMGNAYNNNIAGMAASLLTKWVKGRRTAINDKSAERNAFLAMITKGFRGTDKNDDAWNDLLAGDSGLTSALGIKPSESDARNIGKKPSFIEQIINKTFGHPTQNEKGKRSNILIAKPAGHAIDWEAKAKIMNDAYTQALNRQASGRPEYNDLVMGRLKAIVDATQTRANNMTPADKAAVAELRKKGPALVTKAADASITWVKIKVGDKVGFVSKQYIQLDPNTNTGVITGDDVNFREQPTLSSKVIKMLSKGTKVDYEPGDVASLTTDANGKVINKGAIDNKQDAYKLFNIQLKQKLGVSLSKEEEALLNGDSSALNKIFDNGTTTSTEKVLKATTMNATNKKQTEIIGNNGKITAADAMKFMAGGKVDFAKVAKETVKAVKPDTAIGTANTIKSMSNIMPSMASESVLANAIRSLDVHDELRTIIKYLGNRSGNGNGDVYVIDPRTGKKTVVDTKRENTKRNNGPLLDRIQAMGDTSSKDDNKAMAMLQDAIAIAKGGTFRTVKA